MDEELEALIAEANAERDEIENGEQEEKHDENSEEENNSGEDNKDFNQNKDEDNDESSGVDIDSSIDNVDTSVDNKDENKDEKQEESSGFTPIEIDVNGHKVVVNSQEELLAFAQRGAQSFGKEEKQPTLEEEYLKQGNLTKEDLQLLVDAKNGDSKAIAKLANSYNVDLLDVSNEDAELYKPSFNPTVPSEIDRVAQSILRKPELANKFQTISSSLPESFVSTISSNANDLQTFAQHVESGLAEEIIPLAIKYSYGGIDFGSAYVKAGHEIIDSKQNQGGQQGSQPSTQNREISQREQELRRQAQDKANSHSKKSGIKDDMTEDEVWNLSDEEFEELVKSKK